METKAYSSNLNNCAEIWNDEIKKELRYSRPRLFSLFKFALLIILIGSVIVFITIVALSESVSVSLPAWVKVLGVLLTVILMFRGELWPSRTLQVLLKDAKLGYKFYPQIALELIARKNFPDEREDKLNAIVYKYKHNFENPDLTNPEYFLNEMIKKICGELSHNT
jgi:hypothetical protein